MSKADNKPAAVAARGVTKSYKLGRTRLDVLKGVTMDVREGEFLAITGPSGSGKSTLLHLLGLLDRPDAGQVHLHGADVTRLAGRGRNRLRCSQIGFVFQFYHLMPELTVLENAVLPSMVEAGVLRWLAVRKAARQRARQVLQQVGLSERLRHKPKELSGGERQRVAIARALMNRPRLLLADEPTGNLDTKTGRAIVDLLRRCNAEGQTTVMVTHDAALAAAADRVLVLRDGKLAS